MLTKEKRPGIIHRPDFIAFILDLEQLKDAIFIIRMLMHNGQAAPSANAQSDGDRIGAHCGIAVAVFPVCAYTPFSSS